MDNFYRKENIEVFRKWVYYQVKNDPRLKIEQYDVRTFKIFYQNRVARFVIWPIGIIEEAIYEEQKILFYLHYQFASFHYATDVFYRMIDKLTEETFKTKILLCCTGGLTTGYFAEKLNEFSADNHLGYEFNAISFQHVQDVYNEFDMILIAPQLRYKIVQLTEQLNPKRVASIDPLIFAKYDCHGLIKQIKNGI